MEEDRKYGLLIQPSIKLHRQWFKELCKLHGIYVLYRHPLKDKHYTKYAEIESNFAPPLLTGCIFEQYPSQRTTKMLGWISELQEGSSIIHVDYDLPELQVGCLFIVPSGLDDGKGRLFKVIRMSTVMVYPASVACEIIPEYEDTLEQATINDYTESSFNLLQDESQRIFAGGDTYIS